MKENIVRQATCNQEYIHDRVLKVSFGLMGRQPGPELPLFIVGYAPTEVERSAKDVHANNDFWRVIGRAVQEVVRRRSCFC